MTQVTSGSKFLTVFLTNFQFTLKYFFLKNGLNIQNLKMSLKNL